MSLAAIGSRKFGAIFRRRVGIVAGISRIWMVLGGMFLFLSFPGFLFAEEDCEKEWMKLAVQSNQLFHQQKIDEAIRVGEQALHVAKEACGPEDRRVATSLDNLGAFHNTQGNHAKAEEFHKQAIAIYEKNGSSAHHDLATALDNLSSVYYDQKKYALAEQLQLRAITIYENNLEGGEFDLGIVLNNLALTYDIQGKKEEALAVLERSLHMKEKALGADNLQLISTLDDLGMFYSSRGKNGDVARVQERALRLLESHLGSKHLAVIDRINKLGIFYSTQREHEKSERLFRRSLEILEEKYGPDHPILARTSLNSLAISCLAQEKYLDAEIYYLRAIAILEKTPDGGQTDLVQILFNYAALLKIMKREDEAAAEERRARALQSRISGKEPRP